jgi:CBS domain-containing protein
MTVTYFVRRDFQTVPAYSGIQSIKRKLLHYTALVVLDEDQNTMGILTIADVVSRPHNLVIDCLTHKPTLPADFTLEEALSTMDREQMDVLPMSIAGRFEGLIFRNDLIGFLTRQKRELEILIEERTRDLARQSDLLQQISWIQSHKTRQPLATLLGLIHIIDKTTLSDNNLEIIQMLEKTAQKLDDVIRHTVIKANSVDN